jgi:uncharacterized protein YndB with AHSA1/START domain
MNQKNRAEVTLPSDREILVTRVFDAPRDLVFRAHTDPALIPLWWGQRHSTTVVTQLDVRPGGGWRFVQRSPDGSEYGFRGEFREIAAPERIVQTFEFEGMPGHIVLQNLAFAEQDGKTTLTTREVYASQEDRDGMIASGMESGMHETYARLDELLAKQVAAPRR